jgi:hypothetical protein
MVCAIECLAKPMPMRCVAATTSGALVPPRCGWHQRIDQRGCPPNETPRRRHAILSQNHRTGYPHVFSPLTYTLPRNSTLNTTNLIKPLSGDQQGSHDIGPCNTAASHGAQYWPSMCTFWRCQPIEATHPVPPSPHSHPGFPISAWEVLRWTNFSRVFDPSTV